MIDIETLATSPDALILTIAAQAFNPLGLGWYDKLFYARIDFESQSDRKIEQSTVDWWATQKESQAEAFAEDNRIPLNTALEQLTPLIWQSKQVWTNGSNFDMTILEHAYKSFQLSIPWQYYNVRDARTVYSLYPDLNRPPTSHHALEDCRRQIELLQQCLTHLKVKELK